jgi:hypothetical protein
MLGETRPLHSITTMPAVASGEKNRLAKIVIKRDKHPAFFLADGVNAVVLRAAQPLFSDSHVAISQARRGSRRA